MYGKKFVPYRSDDGTKTSKPRHQVVGLYKSTPITAVVAEAELLPMDLLIERHTLNYLRNLLQNNRLKF